MFKNLYLKLTINQKVAQITFIRHLLVLDLGFRSVQIISYIEKSKSFVFHEDVLEDVFNQKEIAQKPVALYSIAGKRRSGKSFLLHLLMRFIETGKVSVIQRKLISN